MGASAVLSNISVAFTPLTVHAQDKPISLVFLKIRPSAVAATLSNDFVTLSLATKRFHFSNLIVISKIASFILPVVGQESYLNFFCAHFN